MAHDPSDNRCILALSVCALFACNRGNFSEVAKPAAVVPAATAPQTRAAESTPSPQAVGAANAALPVQAPSGQVPDPSPASAARGCSAAMVSVSTARMPRKGTPPTPTGESFCIDRSEVTVADYAACVQQAKCTEPEPYDTKVEDNLYRAFCNWHHPEGRDRHPANCVSFDQARTYCAARGARLPTDVEWRWVASNGDKTAYPWGGAAPDGTRVNGCGTECPAAVRSVTGNPEMRPAYKQNDGYVATAPVGSFSKGDTASGIHDLAGNVSEFVVPVAAPESTGDLTAGGGCFTQDSRMMSASRFTRTAWSSATSPSLGFRCASD
jgi:sulfatase modifying factor 1